jgi:osmoprotectant transport system substrate-binding protein
VAQNLVPLIRSDFLADHADVAEILNGLMAVLTTADIAEAYLEEKDLR